MRECEPDQRLDEHELVATEGAVGRMVEGWRVVDERLCVVSPAVCNAESCQPPVEACAPLRGFTWASVHRSCFFGMMTRNPEKMEKSAIRTSIDNIDDDQSGYRGRVHSREWTRSHGLGPDDIHLHQLLRPQGKSFDSSMQELEGIEYVYVSI